MQEIDFKHFYNSEAKPFSHKTALCIYELFKLLLIRIVSTFWTYKDLFEAALLDKLFSKNFTIDNATG